MTVFFIVGLVVILLVTILILFAFCVPYKPLGTKIEDLEKNLKGSKEEMIYRLLVTKHFILRTYPPDQEEFLKKIEEYLVKLGYYE